MYVCIYVSLIGKPDFFILFIWTKWLLNESNESVKQMKLFSWMLSILSSSVFSFQSNPWKVLLRLISRAFTFTLEDFLRKDLQKIS